MAEPKIIVDRRLLKGFRRRALAAFPLEHMESIHGRLEGKNIKIYSIHPFAAETATEDSVEVDGEHVEEDAEDAEEAGFQSIGQLHSHPYELGAEPSEHDWHHLTGDGWIVLGICAIRPNKHRRSTRIRFYLANPPLAVKSR